MPRFGRYGPYLKAPHPRRSSRGLLRKRPQAGLTPADDRGLKNASENALPSAPIREFGRYVWKEADHADKHSFAATLHPKGLVTL